MNNEVELDVAAMTAEADAAAGPAPADVAVADGGAVVPVTAAEKWGPFLSGMLKVPMFALVLPQWNVPEAMQGEWFESLGESLDQAFPGGPAGKYACWARLCAGTLGIVGIAYVSNDGKLPLGPKRVLRDSEKEPVAASA